MHFRHYLIAVFILSTHVSPAQKGLTILGLQVKPIFPVEFLGTGKIVNDVDGVHFETMLSSGFSAGLIVRHNFTNLIAFESGISYAKRNYSLTITDGDFTGKSDFTIVGYEIPAVLMIYAQVSEKIYVNGSLGPVLDMFASDIQTYDVYFNHVGIRKSTFQPAIAANAGVEYRTEKSGFLYLGASYQRPFETIYLSSVLYDGNNKEVIVNNDLSGSYLTIDFRYYFPNTKTKVVYED